MLPVLSLSISSVVISSFIPDIGNLCLPSFFSWSAWPEVCQFCLFREPAFDVWVLFFYWFSILLISMLCYFFSLIILDLVYFSTFSELYIGVSQTTTYIQAKSNPQPVFVWPVGHKPFLCCLKRKRVYDRDSVWPEKFKYLLSSSLQKKKNASHLA